MEFICSFKSPQHTFTAQREHSSTHDTIQTACGCRSKFHGRSAVACAIFRETVNLITCRSYYMRGALLSNKY